MIHTYYQMGIPLYLMNEWMLSLSVYRSLMLMDAMSIISFFHMTCKLYEVYLRVYLHLML